ncbi:Similar to transposase domain-containing protein [Coprinopsis cinerea okayama7|uniref:Similar to transposase domain-containing protein [Coprinopsis cinerea okayama7\|nr:Similar to transposase domain-containing protein [Coprinopsis cinerea okayama7\
MDLTDMGFTLSTDGVKVFKTRSQFNIWPVMLTNLNLPPSIRSLKRNQILCGFIPGPKNPKDIHAFLASLVTEFKDLQTGIVDVWNAHSI